MTTISQQNAQNVIAKSYDEVPYSSYSFEYNRPENLRSIGILFGMNPPKLEKARILELGCSDAGNLIRFATIYPKSYTLGVDLSSVEIQHGQEKIEALKLKNVELKAISITDLDESYGEFDYIICHGVYSWVPDFVREKILYISKQLLSKDGIAFVSYNTLPGWNMTGTVRELMIYHANNFQEEQERVVQAKLALSFLTESLDGSTTPHAEFMKEAAATMSEKEDYYIRHEYLAEENTAVYFHEFIKDARNQGLEYLGETDLHRMYTGNLPASAAEKLGAINDIVRTEQYIDFIRNTSFRCTLLTHKEVPILRNITFDKIKRLYLTCAATAEIPETKEIYTNNDGIKFYMNNNKEQHLSVYSPAVKSMFYILAQNAGNPLSVSEIVDLAFKKVPNIPKEQIEAELAQNAARLIFAGYFKIFADKPIFKYEISNKPKVSEYAAFQINSGKQNGKYWITNQINGILVFEEQEAHIVKLLDGEHTIDEIKKDIFQKLKTGIITANQDGKKIEDDKELQHLADVFVMQVLNLLRVNYGLVG